jgi:hypothetical protein
MGFLANYRMRWRGIFKGLSQDGGRAVFLKNLRDTLIHFNKDLSNEPKIRPDPSRWTVPLKGLSHEKDLKNCDKNLQNLA